jgi:hypothetical protein
LLKEVLEKFIKPNELIDKLIIGVLETMVEKGIEIILME